MLSNKKTPIIVSFGHRKKVGKDTAAQFFSSYIRLNRRGSSLAIRGFADKVKDIAFQLYSWAGIKPGDYYEMPEHLSKKDIIIPVLQKTPRDCWIGIGNGIRSRVHDATWAEYLFNTIQSEILLIKDLRFPTEADYIKSYNGYVIKVNRPHIIHIPDEADDPLENYTGWTHTIENDSDLFTLNKRIEILAEEILSKLCIPT